MNTNYYMRFQDIISIDQMKPFSMVGVGGIGSHLAIQAAKMGVPHISLYDYDVVDDVNIGTQGFGINDIGLPKVQAIANRMHDFGSNPLIQQMRIDDAAIIDSPILFLALDNITGRELIYHTLNENVQWIIDGRMTAEMGYIFPVNMYDNDSRAFYERFFSKKKMVLMRSVLPRQPFTVGHL